MPIMVQTEAISYNTAIKEEITVAARGIHIGILGGPSVMGAEHLKTWLREATRDRDPIRIS